MKIYKNISDLVGNTPLVEISNSASENNCHAALLCKLEGKNPAGSAKDRVARQMIDAAEKNGVWFFPILVGDEKASWDELRTTALEKLLSGDYATCQSAKKTEFLKNLGG